MATTTTAAPSRKRHRPSIHLMIDGCNGPIRFSEHQLKHAADKEWKGVLTMTRDAPKESSSSKKSGTKKKLPTPSHEAYDSLDIIPLFHRLATNADSPFDSFSVIFDGVSRNKRPDKVDDLESSKKKEWKLDGRIAIEITDIYDETDNIMVERVQKWSQQQTTKHPTNDVEKLGELLERTALSDSEEKESSEDHTLDPSQSNSDQGQNDASCTAMVLTRSSMGPGKARNILQPLGLFRPESVACLFSKGFASEALERNAGDTLTKKLQHSKVGPNLIKCKQERVLKYGDSNELNDSKAHKYPVVVTDDVFLRQRIVDHGGVVMTFYQLWLLLAETQASMDKNSEYKLD